MEVERATCRSGSKLELTRSSPKREQDQKVTQATANTAMSKEFVRSRCCLSACKCNMLTGSCFGDVEEGGAKLDAPRMDLSSMAPPSQGASLIWCQSFKLEIHWRIVPLLTELAPHVVMKMLKRASEAGMRKFSGISFITESSESDQSCRVTRKRQRLYGICQDQAPTYNQSRWKVAGLLLDRLHSMWRDPVNKAVRSGDWGT